MASKSLPIQYNLSKEDQDKLDNMNMIYTSTKNLDNNTRRNIITNLIVSDEYKEIRNKERVLRDQYNVDNKKELKINSWIYEEKNLLSKQIAILDDEKRILDWIVYDKKQEIIAKEIESKYLWKKLSLLQKDGDVTEYKQLIEKEESFKQLRNWSENNDVTRTDYIANLFCVNDDIWSKYLNTEHSLESGIKKGSSLTQKEIDWIINSHPNLLEHVISDLHAYWEQKSVRDDFYKSIIDNHFLNKNIIQYDDFNFQKWFDSSIAIISILSDTKFTYQQKSHIIELFYNVVQFLPENIQICLFLDKALRSKDNKNLIPLFEDEIAYKVADILKDPKWFMDFSDKNNRLSYRYDNYARSKILVDFLNDHTIINKLSEDMVHQLIDSFHENATSDVYIPFKNLHDNYFKYMIDSMVKYKRKYHLSWLIHEYSDIITQDEKIYIDKALEVFSEDLNILESGKKTWVEKFEFALEKWLLVDSFMCWIHLASSKKWDKFLLFNDWWRGFKMNTIDQNEYHKKILPNNIKEKKITIWWWFIDFNKSKKTITFYGKSWDFWPIPPHLHEAVKYIVEKEYPLFTVFFK